jgi:seryl-tRNA synthetase
MLCQSLAISRDLEARLDRALALLPCFETRNELYLSPMLPGDFVLAKNYIKSFQQHSFIVENSVNESEKYLLSPTCCYPVFKKLADSQISDPYLVTHKNICFRCEANYERGVRQSSFLMREYILFSSDIDYVHEWIKLVKEQVVMMLSDMGISARIEKASDPFFNANDFKRKIQESENLKSEFIVDQVAIGSVNSHLKSFSKSCNIKSKKGDYFYSACFGLGYDRVSAKLGLSITPK